MPAASKMLCSKGMKNAPRSGALCGADLGGEGVGGAELGGDELGGAELCDDALRGAELGDEGVGGAEFGGDELGGAALAGFVFVGLAAGDAIDASAFTTFVAFRLLFVLVCCAAAFAFALGFLPCGGGGLQRGSLGGGASCAGECMSAPRFLVILRSGWLGGEAEQSSSSSSSLSLEAT